MNSGIQVLIWYIYMLQYEWFCRLAEISMHNHFFFCVVRTFEIYCLSSFQIYKHSANCAILRAQDILSFSCNFAASGWGPQVLGSTNSCCLWLCIWLDPKGKETQDRLLVKEINFLTRACYSCSQAHLDGQGHSSETPSWCPVPLFNLRGACSKHLIALN